MSMQTIHQKNFFLKDELSIGDKYGIMVNQLQFPIFKEVSIRVRYTYFFCAMKIADNFRNNKTS